jgi:hypothetical protein
VTSYLLEATGQNGSSIGTPVWENDWGKKKVDARTQESHRQASIDAILAGYPYFFTPTSQGLSLSSRITKTTH